MSQVSVSCPHCEERFILPKKSLGQEAECSNCGNSFITKQKKVKKKSNGKFVFLLLLVILGAGLPFFLVGKDELKKATVEKKKEVFTGPGFLLNVKENATYEKSPFAGGDQWRYAPVAKTYANVAGVYPLLFANASLEGEKLYYNSVTDTLEGWESMGYATSWKLAEVPFTGKYDVYVRYGAVPEQLDNGIRMKIAGQTVSTMIQNTGGATRFTRQKMGTVKLTKGQSYTAKVEATFIEEGTSVCDLNAIEIVPSESADRWFDTARNEWSNDIPRSLRLSAKTIDQRPPAQFIKDGAKGFVIITTLEFKKHSKYLKEFIKHKESLAYTVTVITDLDFGGGEGVEASQNIRQWLNQNYKEQGLLYALMIGNPNPHTGNVPMGLVDEKIVTDMIYADCSQSTDDFSSSNFDAQKGLDGVWDVLVGRIPYYGEKSEASKASDIDKILKKTVAYELASPEEILERYHFAVNGYSVDAHFVEFTGFPYTTDSQLAKAYLALDYKAKKGAHFIEEAPVSLVKLTEASSQEFSGDWYSKKKTPKDVLNLVSLNTQAASADPVKQDNDAYLFLKNGAIASLGETMEASDEAPKSYAIQPKAFSDFHRTLLMNRYSVGQAHWATYNQGQNIPSAKALARVLYGDPSVIPFPESLNARRPFVVRPVHDLALFEPTKVDAIVKLPRQEFDLKNLSSKAQAWSVKVDVPWIDLALSQGELQAGETVTIKATFNKKARALAAKTHTATLTILVDGQKETRRLIFKRYDSNVELSKDFKETDSGTLVLTGDAVSLLEDQKLLKPLDRTLSFNLKADNVAGLKSLITGQGLGLTVNPETKALEFSLSPYNYGSKATEMLYGSPLENAKNKLSLKGKTALKEQEWLAVAISISYSKKIVNLYLNGKIEDSIKLPSYYYALLDLKTGEGLKAEIDDFQIQLGAISVSDAQKLYKLTKKK